MILLLRPPFVNVMSFSTAGLPKYFGRTQRTSRSFHETNTRTRRMIASASPELEAMIGSRCRKAFEFKMPEGTCVGVELLTDHDNDANSCTKDDLSLDALSSNSHWIRDYLHAQEVTYGLGITSDTSRQSFLLGRLALRQALESHNSCFPRQQQQQQQQMTTQSNQEFQSSFVLLKDEYGRPSMPLGFLGSISHKGNLAVGLVSSCTRLYDAGGENNALTSSIGIDLEHCGTDKSQIAKRVLTAQERTSLGNVAGLSSEEEVLLRFSVKEALYKAMHPLICQYVGLREAETQPCDDGSVQVSLELKSKAHLRFASVQAHWQRLGEFFLTSARIELNGDRPEECHVMVGSKQ